MSIYFFILVEIAQIFETLHYDPFGIQNPVWLQLLRRLRLGCSHLNEYKFKYTFHDFLSPLIAYNLEPEMTSHYLMPCHLIQIERKTLPNNIKVSCHLQNEKIRVVVLQN